MSPPENEKPRSGLTGAGFSFEFGLCPSLRLPRTSCNEDYEDTYDHKRVDGREAHVIDIHGTHAASQASARHRRDTHLIA